MREAAFESHRSCVKPCARSRLRSHRCFRLPFRFSVCFFKLIISDVQMRFRRINIGAYSNARPVKHRGSMQCERSLSQTITSYSSNLTPYPYWKQEQSCTPAGMFGVFSLIWYVRINFSWIVRQDVAIVTLCLPDSSLGCFIYSSLFL